MKRRQLRKSEIKALEEETSRLYRTECFLKKDKVEETEADVKVVLKNGVPCFFFHEGMPVPTLKLLLEKDLLKKVTVDMGAVRFVVSGADIMRPGITHIDVKIEKGEFVAIVDEKNQKPLAVAVSLISGVEMDEMKTGKTLKNLHHVGDLIWNIGSLT